VSITLSGGETIERPDIFSKYSPVPSDVRFAYAKRRVWRLAEADPDLVEWKYGEYEVLRTAEVLASRPDWSCLATIAWAMNHRETWLRVQVAS
jgi:hypothetical protein